MSRIDNIIKFTSPKKYTLVSELGRGSFGKTILVKDNDINERFVIKKYEPSTTADTSFYYQNFKEEIRILFKLNHKNIVRIYNFYLYEKQSTGYIIMENIEGDPIDVYINEKFILDSDIINHLFTQAIDAFKCIESSNIIHRDIRENNILVTKEGELKIIDFGLGKICNKNKEDSLKDDIDRDLESNAPQEYIDGIYDIKTDMFYLGRLFKKMIDTPEKEAAFKYGKILDKMTQILPNMRYSSFNMIGEEIDAFGLTQLHLTPKVKRIYRNFAESLYDSIANYEDEKEFEHKIDTIIFKLREVVRLNMFEEELQTPNELIRIFVKGQYSYYKNRHIQVATVKDFLDLLEKLEDNDKKIIIDNIANKLNAINTNYSVPF